MFSNITKENLFHAYICEGASDVLEQVKEFIQSELAMSISGNPDVFVKHYEAFGIADSREVTRLAQLKPIGERKILCISSPSMTVEAQDALLKLFEEPPVGTHFFVVLPSVQNLRPTLLSRVQILTPSVQSDALYTGVSAKGFLKADYAKRLEMVAKIAKGKDRASALELLNALEDELYKSGDIKNEEIKIGLEAIAQARKYLGDKGSMLKQLLESVAIQLPIEKN